MYCLLIVRNAMCAILTVPKIQRRFSFGLVVSRYAVNLFCTSEYAGCTAMNVISPPCGRMLIRVRNDSNCKMSTE